MKLKLANGPATGVVALSGLLLSQSVVVMLIGQAALAEEPVRYTITGPSVANIERGEDGQYNIQAQESRYWLTQNYHLDPKFVPRLVTTTTNWSWDGEEKYSVVVTIDELGGPQPRRIAQFSDPGSSGNVLSGSNYYVTTQPPCCTATGLFHVRSLETAQLLFTSTGNGEVGAATFMFLRPPGTDVDLERWVAFEGNRDSSADPVLLGHIRYGDTHGVLSDVEVRVKAGRQRTIKAGAVRSEAEDASVCGFLRWVVPGYQQLANAPRRPAVGKCDFDGKFDMQPLGAYMRDKPQTDVGGFEVEFSISGRVYATIPITHDRLDPAHAEGANRTALTTVAASR